MLQPALRRIKPTERLPEKDGEYIAIYTNGFVGLWDCVLSVEKIFEGRNNIEYWLEEFEYCDGNRTC